MLPVAFARPLWAATLRTLRRLTRLAVTALVLVVGLGGATAAPAEASRPAAEPGQVATFQVPTASFASPATAGRDASPATAGRSAGTDVERVAAPSAASAAEQLAGVPSGRPAGAGPERSVRHAPTASPASATRPAPADPGRDAVGRRGPPRG